MGNSSNLNSIDIFKSVLDGETYTAVARTAVHDPWRGRAARQGIGAQSNEIIRFSSSATAAIFPRDNVMSASLENEAYGLFRTTGSALDCRGVRNCT